MSGRGVIRCKICPDFIFDNNEAIEEHMSYHAHQLFTCIACQEPNLFGMESSFVFKSEIVQHLQTIHDDKLDYGRTVNPPLSLRSAQCLLCENYLLCQIKRVVQDHSVEHEDSKFELGCRECLFVTRDWEEWDEHCEWHQDIVHNYTKIRVNRRETNALPSTEEKMTAAEQMNVPTSSYSLEENFFVRSKTDPTKTGFRTSEKSHLPEATLTSFRASEKSFLWSRVAESDAIEELYKYPFLNEVRASLEPIKPSSVEENVTAPTCSSKATLTSFRTGEKSFHRPRVAESDAIEELYKYPFLNEVQASSEPIKPSSVEENATDPTCSSKANLTSFRPGEKSFHRPRVAESDAIEELCKYSFLNEVRASSEQIKPSSSSVEENVTAPTCSSKANLKLDSEAEFDISDDEQSLLIKLIDSLNDIEKAFMNPEHATLEQEQSHSRQKNVSTSLRGPQETKQQKNIDTSTDFEDSRPCPPNQYESSQASIEPNQVNATSSPVKTFKCNWCQIRGPSAFNLHQHFVGKKHGERMNASAARLTSFSCDICGKKLRSDETLFREHINSSFHMDALEKSEGFPENPNLKRIGLTNKLEPDQLSSERKNDSKSTWLPKFFLCKWCKVPCPSAINLQQHFIGKKHLTKMTELAENLPQFTCGFCNIDLPTKIPSFVEHVNSKSHRKAMYKLIKNDDASLSNIVSDDVVVFRSFRCSWCGINCPSPDKLQKHFLGAKHLQMMNAGGSSLKKTMCGICIRPIRSVEDFEPHMKSKTHLTALSDAMKYANQPSNVSAVMSKDPTPTSGSTQ